MNNICKGKNISFYYCGNDHMLINLYKYIKNNIKNNIFIYLNINNKIYELLQDYLEDTEKIMVCNNNMKNIILDNNEKTIEEFLNRYKDEKIEKGFSSVKFIFDVKNIVNNSGKLVFEEFSNNIYNIIHRNNMEMLFLYDFEDYLNNGNIINEQIIKLSYVNHTHRMFSDEIITIDEFKINKNLA